MEKSKIYVRQRKRIISTLCVLAMFAALLPMMPQSVARAADNYYSGVCNPLELPAGTYTLDNVTINATNGSGIALAGNVTLNIIGTNRITGSSRRAGIWVPNWYSLTIQGNGTLYATGGDAGAGKDAIHKEGIYGGGGCGAGAGIGSDGGYAGYDETSPGANSGRVTIRETVKVIAKGGNGADGGTGGTQDDQGTVAGAGGGGGGYPAAGIGGGGAAGGNGASNNGETPGAGGGGFSGGGGGSFYGSNSGDAGWNGDGGWNGVNGDSIDDSTWDSGGGGGYFSAGHPNDATNQGGGAIGGGGGAGPYNNTNGRDGGMGGKGNDVIVHPNVTLTASNGGTASGNLKEVTFNRGANQPRQGIGGGAGYTEQSGGSYIQAQVPGTPNNPTVSPENKQVTISWTAPANNGVPITQYEVFQNGTSIGTTNSLSMVKTGLNNGTSYSYTVRAYNDVGWGNKSAAASATPRTVPSVPSAPTVSPGNGQNVITWSVPANNGATITKYELKRGSTVLKSDITGTSYTDTGLSNGTSYSYTVRAYNAAGWGGFSSAGSGTPRTVPATPTISVTAGNKQNVISWSTPANNGASITKYEISRKTGSGSYTVLNSNYTSTSYTDPSLTAGTTYTYRVRAYNAAGWGNYSAEKSASPYTTPGTPSTPVVSPGNGQNVITWSTPANNGATITKYELKRGSTVVKSDITGTSYTDTGLSNGTSYSYTVRAYNTAGWGGFSSAGSGTPRTVPATPTISVTAGNKQNVISWSTPANNGASITKYEISRKTGSGSYTVLNSNYTSTSYTDPSLTAGTAYTYRVRAYNAAGWGNYSAEKSASPYTTPGTPSTPVVSPGNGQNVITWSVPANGGSVITKYELKRGSTVVKSDITGTSYTDTGLSNGTSYSYTVRAYNAAGWGDFSAAVSGTPRTVPNAPAKPSVAPGDDKNTVTWAAPAANGAAVTAYELSRNGVVVSASITSTSYVDSGLQTQYGAQKYFPVDMGLFVI